MTSRERVLRALAFEPTDRVPMDLGGMASTGISCFAYPRLVEALGLSPRRPRIHDTNQMLALPDLDVLDALDCDVVAIHWAVTNAFDEPGKWHEYGFGGRLDSLVQRPEDYVALPDGTIERPKDHSEMPPSSFFFDDAHGGQPLDPLNEQELPLSNLNELWHGLKADLPTASEIENVTALCRRVREATSRAVFFTGPVRTSMSIMGHGGLGVFPVICLLRPDYVAEYHEILTAHVIAKMEILLPRIGPHIDVIMLSADDWGTQQSTIASPATFRKLFLPYYRRLNEAAHRLAPEAKTFLHSCGAIYDIIDDIVEARLRYPEPGAVDSRWSFVPRVEGQVPRSYRSVGRRRERSTDATPWVSRGGRARGKPGGGLSYAGRRLRVQRDTQSAGRSGRREGARDVPNGRPNGRR